MLGLIIARSGLALAALFIVQTMLSSVPDSSIAFKRARMPAIAFSITDRYLDEAQGTSRCIDDLEALYGEGALVPYGESTYSIANICDYE